MDSSDKWEIIHIPEKPALSPDQQPTVKVYASLIKPKFANTIVRHLCKIAPLEDLRHVKRVKKKILPDRGETQLTVILCLAPEHHDRLNDSMPPDVQKLVDPYELSPFITQVCKYAAVSKEEWEEQSKIWPTSFHPPTYNIDGIGGFSEEDTESICKFMRVVIDMAVSGHKPLVNAAVIVDPSVRRIIASETDQVYASSGDNTSTETSPFKETGDICLNDTLEKQNGSLSAVACLNPWNWSLQPHDTEKCSLWHPLRHASMVSIESSSARDRHLFPNSSEIFGQDHVHPSNMDSPAKKQKTSSQSPHVQIDSREETLRDPSMERPYLCTGYDIFLLLEPCTMCAMALVHQRIKRIFYAIPNPTAGGLGSVHRLQGEKSLNHHYAVFRVLLPDDALRQLASV
ncbi:PREDICTED: probable inactive tRNA-specific adenosine deaminase-like protein 3 [Camelina sativa]|uniref:Probable inactive tRNA-specific adenosine deaminase-like protein 3 n=1 Tax=Camelina sativa TaxID=90675 RepID=A0ABM0TL20_CAMSA|nr:PREDICTED: probable inactive tRNA-specific adenosine deaminase-like protein 3 [Camelina sativa]XP_010427960.1 PREDICTED: probable inactive tRNA-specific adenosine deaminase-like protein 3 [Camelina sativa]XP_010427961.1 PREDICTED: probable inactive tRNA-specific adenosine deaminase-like protein 3 [Camelina sativa]XP_010427962.1 PREDICTED: probable inactive tRNA-specific adenosine deaminase-like protein 3 [Camelina sativa]